MRQPAKTFQDLIVWQKGHQFVLSIYQFTGQFPKTETYGLTSQFRLLTPDSSILTKNNGATKFYV